MKREDIIKEFEERALSAQVLKFFPNETKRMIIDKDINVVASGCTSECTIDRIVKGNKAQFEEFELVGKGKNKKEALDNLIDEDNKITYNLLLHTCDFGTSRGNQVISQKQGENYKSLLEQLQYAVERNRLLVDKFLVGKLDFDGIVRGINCIDYDPCALPAQGLVGSVWGVNIYVLDIVSMPLHSLIAVTEGQYIGIRTITAVTIDNKIIKIKGQMGVVNPRAVSCVLPDKCIKKSIDFDCIKEEIRKFDKITQDNFTLIVDK